jgi:hypothetical protein
LPSAARDLQTPSRHRELLELPSITPLHHVKNILLLLASDHLANKVKGMVSKKWAKEGRSGLTREQKESRK